MNAFSPTHTEALRRLSAFVPKAGRDYAAKRNYALGPARHAEAVSVLSPYIRHRLITEEDVLTAVLARHSSKAAEKFIQEVFWRTYWKGWLEMRPSVWTQYKSGLWRAWNQIQTQSGQRDTWEAACKGETGIDCFDSWAHELFQTGYLHNHARMWFASIWVFTLRLPWELGADFFMRHLLDGDAASNTLSWRWVAGLQTRGKHYIARASNISKYTEGQFCPAPGVLNTSADPLPGSEHPPRLAPPQSATLDPSLPTAVLLHEDDLNPGFLAKLGLNVVGAAVLPVQTSQSPLYLAEGVLTFRNGAVADMAVRWQERFGQFDVSLPAQDIGAWARDRGTHQIVTPYAPVGPVAEALQQIKSIPVRQVLRDYDASAWPHATAGFFKFKAKIPELLGSMNGLKVA